MTLLSPDNSRIWIQHLNTVLQNRKCGAAKATTRRTKKIALKVPTTQLPTIVTHVRRYTRRRLMKLNCG